MWLSARSISSMEGGRGSERGEVTRAAVTSGGERAVFGALVIVVAMMAGSGGLAEAR